MDIIVNLFVGGFALLALFMPPFTFWVIPGVIALFIFWGRYGFSEGFYDILMHGGYYLAGGPISLLIAIFKKK